MNNIIFARPRQQYDSYSDFFRLVELAGFPLIYLDEVNWQDDSLTVIATPKHGDWDYLNIYTHRCRFIWWNLERGLIDAPIMDIANPAVPPYVDETWCSDRALAQTYGYRYVFLGGHRTFGSIDIRRKQYDYISLMYWVGRRMALVPDLHGLSSADLPTGTWGKERHERLMASRLMLSAHQDDQPWCEPVRFMIAACYALPLLSETCQDSGYWLDGYHYVGAALGELAITARRLIEDETTRVHLGIAAWRLACVEWPFRRCVEEAVKAQVTA